MLVVAVEVAADVEVAPLSELVVLVLLVDVVALSFSAAGGEEKMHATNSPEAVRASETALANDASNLMMKPWMIRSV